MIRGRSIISTVMIVAGVLCWGPPNASLAAASPCAIVRDIELPSDELGLRLIQLRILACARHLQLYRFGKENKQQCVGFANELMDILRPGARDRVVGQSAPHTAGRFTETLRQRRLLFARDEASGLPLRPSETKSRPVYVWWDTSQIRNGHVGVYIGGGLFVDEYVAFELGKLTGRQMRAISDPSRWAWSVAPKPQSQVPWPEGHWPRQRVNDGFSVVRVRGA